MPGPITDALQRSPQADNPGPITTALRRWENGDDAAQFDLERALRPFLCDMLRFIRRHREAPLRPRIDSEGVIYDALKSFLTGVRKDEFPAVQNHVAVRKVLTTLIIRTLRDEIKRHRAQRRTPHREQPGANQDDLLVAANRQPGAKAAAPALELAALMEEFLKVVRRVHPKAIDIVSLLFEGLTTQEIAGEVGLGIRRVQQIVEQTLTAWEEAVAKEEEHGC